MDDHAQEEDIDVFQRLGGEEVVVLEGEAGGDGGGQGGQVWAGAFDGVPEVLDDEGEVGEGSGEGDAGVAIGAAELERNKFH